MNNGTIKIPQTATENIAPPKTERWQIILALAFLFAVILTCALALSRVNFGKNKTQVTFSPTITPITPPVAASNSASLDALNWKTYKNDVFGFEFKYPAQVKIDKEFDDQFNRGVLLSGQNITFSITLKKDEKLDGNSTPLDKFNYLGELPSGQDYLGQAVAKIFKSKGYCDGLSCGGPYIAYAAKKNDDFYILSFSINTNSDLLELSTLEKQILSTFKFTEKTDNWNTYINESYKYSINYPPDWTFKEYADTKSGAAFRPANKQDDFQSGFITINKGVNKYDDTRSFDDYVRTAGIEEVQNYHSLNSIKKLDSSEITGYETTWVVEDMTSSKTYISNPITYLYYPDKLHFGIVEVVLNNPDYLNVYRQMVLTFKLR